MVKVVSTFCGAGGSSCGYKMAGCTVILASDFEKNAIETYKLNFPKTKTLCCNIRDLTGQEILKITGLKKGELDIFDGSPPCTPFSTCGKREKSWGVDHVSQSEKISQVSDDLFFEYIRLVKELEPRMFIAENVKGLIIGTAKGYYNMILREMKKCGYDMQVLSLNAKNFEVPHSRSRIIFIGTRKDLKVKFPKLLKANKQVITLRTALKGVKNSRAELEFSKKSIGYNFVQKRIHKIKPGDSLGKVDGSLFSLHLLHWDRICPAITTMAYKFLYVPDRSRSLTLSELKRLTTFPDDFKFLSIIDGGIRMGNAVPPKLMYHVAKHAKKILKSSGKTLALTDKKAQFRP